MTTDHDRAAHISPPPPPPIQDINILNQHIDDDEGVYRIQHGHKVGYLAIPTGLLDEDTMCRPYLLIPNLPALPTTPWTRLYLSRGGQDGETLHFHASNDPLPAISHPWSAQQIDILTLPRTKRYRSNVHEVSHDSQPAIAKIAAFEWDIPRMRTETWAYPTLHQHQQQETSSPSRQIAPRVLAQLTENGRTIGLLLEKVEGSPASMHDLAGCEETLRAIHRLGLVHGDVNRHNFLVERGTGRVCLVDFEHAEEYEAGKAGAELDSLTAELGEESGRGAANVF